MYEPGTAVRISCLSAEHTRLHCPSCCYHICLYCGAAAFVRKQMEARRLWGTMPGQAWPLHFPGGEEIAQGPDMGLEEDYPVICPGL